MRSNHLLPCATFKVSIARSFAAFCVALLVVLSGCAGGSGGSSGSGGTTAPAPSVTGVSPVSIVAGSGAFTLSVNGSNFQAQAVVKWNGTALVTTFASTSSLSAAVPASLGAVGATAAITVVNPDGQVSAGGSASQQFTVTNPAPTLSTVSPLSLYPGSSDTTFTFTGTNFNSSSVVMAGPMALATTLVSSTQLTAVVPAILLASAGTLSLSVSNPLPGGGSSQNISITVRLPTATLVSLSPSSATAGSPAVTVTLAGSNFTPTAVVYIDGNYSAPTTFVSSTSIQFAVPATYLANAGSLSVIVRDPAALNVPSNVLTFSINNPVPVLNSISPLTITAGTPNFILTLSGSNFLTSSTILINGTATQPVSFPTPTSATVLLPASAVSTVGTVSIAVQNPAPDGGTSASQTLNIISANNRIRTVNVNAADLGWDSVHNLLIASTLSSSGTNPNSIVAIDPLQGTVTTVQSLPGQPAGISVTGDGSYVYVTLPTTGQVERLILPSLTPDITFSLGNNGSGAAFTSNYVVAAPGLPHTVAIARQSTGESSVAIFDDGVARPNIATTSAVNSVYATLTWGADATTLYGTNTVVSSADEDTFSVNSTGVTLLSDEPNGIGEFVKNLAFDTKTGRLVDGYGDVVNAATGQSVGQMQVQNTLTYEENPFALDTTQRKAFYLNAVGFYTSNPPNGSYIQAFNLDQFSYINSLLVEGLSGGSTIVRWGTSGLATNGSQIYLIDGSFVAPTGVTSPVGGYVAVSPTLSSINPASVVAGSADTKVTLTGSNFTQASEVTWNNQSLLIDAVSDTQITVTVPVASLATPVASAVSVNNSPGTGSSNLLGFSVLPNLGASAQVGVLDISAQDLAWDSTRGLLYVAVPASDATLPNTVSVVDPTKLAIQQTVSVADQPSALSLSDDSQYLYVGSFGQAVVQRYALPSFSLDLTIPTGAGFPANAVGTHNSCTYPIDIKAAPGNPQTIAVAQGNEEVEPRGCGSVAIYDNATPRSNTLPYPSTEITSFAWGADASTLFGQSDGSLGSASLDSLAISSSGVGLQSVLNSGSLGLRVHYDSGTKLLYSDSGVITNPVGPVQVGTFATGILTVTDSALKRAFVLIATPNTSGSGQGATSYTLEIFDLNTLALLNSIVIPDVLGYPQTMARWGSNGLVIGTIGEVDTTGSVGALYVLQGSGISGTQ